MLLVIFNSRGWSFFEECGNKLYDYRVGYVYFGVIIVLILEMKFIV